MTVATAAVRAETGADELHEAPLIRLSRIVPNPHQPRKTFIEATIIDLADNIQAEGQRTPVEVCRVPGQPGTFMLIAGERRYRALHKIWERTGKEPLVKAFIETVKDQKELFRKSVIENLHREDMCALDTASAYLKLHQDGDSVAKIAEMAKKSVSHVEGYLKLTTLPDEVKAMLDPNLPKERQLAVTTAIDIARGIPPHEKALRIQLAREAMERELGVAEARMLVEHEAVRKGYAVGGSERRPSQDYNVLAGFIGRFDKQLLTMLKMDIPEAYRHREDPGTDQEEHEKALERLIQNLTLLKKKVKDAV